MFEIGSYRVGQEGALSHLRGTPLECGACTWFLGYGHVTPTE